jgi:hypothetical protein
VDGFKRVFRLRIRPGRVVFSSSADPERDPLISAGAGEEVVVSEKTAAFLVRQRSAEIIEVIEKTENDRPAE